MLHSKYSANVQTQVKEQEQRQYNARKAKRVMFNSVTAKFIYAKFNGQRSDTRCGSDYKWKSIYDIILFLSCSQLITRHKQKK